MPGISELVTISRRELVQGSEFDSSYGIDEVLFSSMQNRLPANLSMGESRRRLHPTVSELWICDTGCGVPLTLPYVRETEKLSKGEVLVFPALKPEDILRGPPYMQSVSGYCYRITDTIELTGGLKVYGVDGINKGSAKVAGAEDISGNYFYAIGKFSPRGFSLLKLSIGYGKLKDPLLQIDVKYIPDEQRYLIEGTVTANSKFIDCSIELGHDGSVKSIKFNGSLPQGVANVNKYISKLAQERNLEGICGPLLEGRKVDFYETIKALVEFGLCKRGNLNKVLKF